MRQITILSLCLTGVLSSSALGATIIPTSYTATPGQGTAQGGSWDYFDDTGSQLTDGGFGVDDWTANLGNGPAYEWVGWRTVDPSFTFNFASTVTVDKVFIDFERAQGAGIYLPTTVTIGGTTFTLTGNELPNQTRGTLEFDGSWTGSSLSMDMTRSLWLFVDEVQFNAVPEPAGFALVAGLGLVGFALCRRRSTRCC